MDSPASPQSSGPVTPTQHDVLFGRGSFVFNHAGNRFFRKLVKERRELYNLANSAADKGAIVKEIIHVLESLEPPGRFLIPNDETTTPTDITTWFNVDVSRAKAKTAQALREGGPKIRASAGMKSEREKLPSRSDTDVDSDSSSLVASTSLRLSPYARGIDSDLLPVLSSASALGLPSVHSPRLPLEDRTSSTQQTSKEEAGKFQENQSSSRVDHTESIEPPPTSSSSASAEYRDIIYSSKAAYENYPNLSERCSKSDDIILSSLNPPTSHNDRPFKRRCSSLESFVRFNKNKGKASGNNNLRTEPPRPDLVQQHSMRGVVPEFCESSCDVNFNETLKDPFEPTSIVDMVEANRRRSAPAPSPSGKTAETSWLEESIEHISRKHTGL